MGSRVGHPSLNYYCVIEFDITQVNATTVQCNVRLLRCGPQIAQDFGRLQARLVAYGAMPFSVIDFRVMST